MNSAKYLKKLSGNLLNFPSRLPLEFNLRNLKKIVIIATAVLLAVILFLGWMSAKKVREVVVEDFNQQQLVLAQHAASQIKNSLSMLKRELTLLSLSPSVQYSESVFIGKRMEIAFSSIRDEGVLEIRFVEHRKTHLVDSTRYQAVLPSPEYSEYLKWADRKENRDVILISDVSPSISWSDPRKLIMRMVIPVWQVSVDESHPVATNRFSGVIIFVIDATRLIEKVTKEIRSGKTGYAWVIDKNGTFLYHPEKDFIGKNAFEACKERAPAISFARINEIQKEKMLAGKEGTSWYISGWHRGRESEMKKLIAYSPINLDEKEAGQVWSVAVVAPVSEVEGAIHSVQVR